MNPTLDLLFSRRSERNYSKEPVSQEDKDLIVQSALRAPTAGNMMLYSMIEVDEEQKKILVSTCDNQPFIAKAPFVLLFLADMQRWYDFFAHCQVPEKCQKENMIFSPPEEADLMLACCDALIAAQNAVIGAESLQIGSCYIGDIMENHERHRELFNLPRWAFPITMLCFGHSLRKERKYSTIPRFPKESVYHKSRYHHLTSDQFAAMFSERIEVLKGEGWQEPAENIGQHFYFRKTGSSYMQEMRRSVKVALKDWRGIL